MRLESIGALIFVRQRKKKGKSIGFSDLGGKRTSELWSRKTVADEGSALRKGTALLCRRGRLGAKGPRMGRTCSKTEPKLGTARPKFEREAASQLKVVPV